jgi:L-ribulose-5-phosphate 3-epimerase
MNRRDLLKLSGCAAVAAAVDRVGAAELNRLKIGAISDEISDDLEYALRFLESYGLRYVEIRKLWRTYVWDADSAAVRKARELIEKYKMTVPMMDVSYLKSTLPGTTILPVGSQYKLFHRDYSEQPALLDAATARARELGAPAIRVFSFWRTANPPALFDSIAEHLTKAAEIGARNKVKVALENEAACNVGTAAELAAVLKRTRHPNLYIVWDPGNAYMEKERPYPDGYEMLPKDRICHMHLKDAGPNPATGRLGWRPIGGGQIDFLGMFRAMLKDGFQGMFSLETHYYPGGNREAGSRESLEGLLAVMKKV